MAESRQTSGTMPPPDVMTALAAMASHMMERQMELMQDLMRCSDPAAVTAATTQWTERCITGLINDQARVVEATAAQVERFVRAPLQ